MHYNFVEHTADIAVDVYGNSLADLFEASALAWRESVFEEYSPSEGESYKFKIVKDSIEELLVEFLSELNYLVYTKRLTVNHLNELKIELSSGLYILSAEINVEKFQDKKHTLKEEIKAVTFHQMHIVEKDGEYKTRIVFDI
ncbi:MAG: archease [Melioribacteraceae bacterium]|nr:archease [Melioribacteraceae bacterium]MCF8356971.1 archease [Melioribacteraceae bacterium]MCF8394121.1 archease [Melioribacteraceae bacterium]MCF8418141.1 archease [Melioribacteraceae bacterium]